MTETQWITLIETADIIKTLPTKVARMCEEGKLEYYKEGDHYFISVSYTHLTLPTTPYV